MMNDIVIVLVCAKCLKIITSEENTINVQQLPLCLPLFFVFSSEVIDPLSANFTKWATHPTIRRQIADELF